MEKKKKKAWGKIKNVNQLPTQIQTRRNRFYCLHHRAHTDRISCDSIVPHIIHLQCRLCIRAHVAHAYHVHKAVAPEASGLVFDSMLSEWLISQCFDLLQLLEVCLVRAWIWHTLRSIMWLHYILCFFFFQFSFWKNIFMFKVLKFWYHTYFTHAVMNRLYNQAFVELKTKMQCVILLQFLYGYYWIVIIITFRFFSALSLLFDSNKHSGSSINALIFFFFFLFETWIMLVHKTM